MNKDKRNWMILLGVGAIIIITAVWVGMARAQGQEVVVYDSEWMALLQQVVLLIVSGLLIPAVLQFLRDRGLRIEEKHAAHIQLTARNAAALILDPHLSPEQRKIRAMSYMRTGAKDALDYFKSDPERAYLIVLSYYNQLTQELPVPPIPASER